MTSSVNIEEVRKALSQQLQAQQMLLNNYLDLAVDQSDDEAYVARGNGFCDAKYSDDFIDSQIVAIKSRIAEIEKKLSGLSVAENVK